MVQQWDRFHCGANVSSSQVSVGRGGEGFRRLAAMLMLNGALGLESGADRWSAKDTRPAEWMGCVGWMV